MDAAPSPPLPKMTPPLIEAVCTGDQDLVELLLEHRASLAARDVAYGAGPHQHYAFQEPRTLAPLPPGVAEAHVAACILGMC